MLVKSLLLAIWAAVCFGVDAGQGDYTVPEYLTPETFHTALLETVTLVEFFSPYCHHCTKLAPIWAAAQKEVLTDYASLHVSMRQVDCVAQGDLCVSQLIEYFPQLRLYVPTTDPATGTKRYEFAGNFPRTLEPTQENIVSYMKNVADEYELGEISSHSSSVAVTPEAMEKISSGDMDRPHFVAFFSANNDEWQESSNEIDLHKNPFNELCLDCLEGRVAWGRLLNQISARIDVGHVMCRSELAMCKSSDILQNDGQLQRPRFFAYLPQSNSAPPVEYTGPLMVKEMRRFIDRVAENLNWHAANLNSLKKDMSYVLDISPDTTTTKYPLENKVALVYKKEPLMQSDLRIMAHLVSFAANSPFDVYFYTSKDESLADDLQVRARNLAEHVQLDPADTRPKYDAQLFSATNNPIGTSIMFYHDNSLVDAVYQVSDAQDVAQLDRFLKANQFPLVQELTPAFVPVYFSEDKETVEKKVVILFTDSANTNALQEGITKLRSTATQYHYEKQRYLWDQLHAQRPDLASADFLSQESVAEIQSLRTRMPELYENDDTLFTFIDLAKVEKFKKLGHWAQIVHGANAGEIIILSKDGRYVWNTTPNGEKLNLESALIAHELVALNFASKGRRKLFNSPFGNIFPPLDYVHDHGFLGYFILFVVVVAIYYAWASISRRRRARTTRDNNVGLLGTFNIAKAD